MHMTVELLARARVQELADSGGVSWSPSLSS
jgi:hypothetical protein